MLRNRKAIPSSVVITGLGVFAAHGNAAPIVTQSPYQTTAFTVSSVDLINGHLPSVISGTGDQESLDSDTTGKALTDGTFGPANPYHVGGSPSMTIANNGASITYYVPSGDTITEIDSYSAWQDGGRSQQNYTVSTSTDGVHYTTLATVNASQDPYGGPYPPDNKPSDDKVAITDSTGTLATGVKYIRFDFPSVENTYVGLTELDVIPEPASLSLLGLGGLGLLVRRRKA